MKKTKFIVLIALFLVTSLIAVSGVKAATVATTPADAAAGAGLGAFSFLFSSFFSFIYCLICCLPFTLQIVISILIYKDAVKYNVDPPILWALVVIFFPLFGILIYFLGPRADQVRIMQQGSAPVAPQPQPAPAPQASNTNIEESLHEEKPKKHSKAVKSS